MTVMCESFVSAFFQADIFPNELVEADLDVWPCGVYFVSLPSTCKLYSMTILMP